MASYSIDKPVARAYDFQPLPEQTSDDIRKIIFQSWLALPTSMIYDGDGIPPDNKDEIHHRAVNAFLDGLGILPDIHFELDGSVVEEIIMEWKLNVFDRCREAGLDLPHFDNPLSHEMDGVYFFCKRLLRISTGSLKLAAYYVMCVTSILEFDDYDEDVEEIWQSSFHKTRILLPFKQLTRV